MLSLEYLVLTIRHDSRGEDTVVASAPFSDLDEAQRFVNKEPILVPPEDANLKNIKYLRHIRRTREPVA